MQRRSSNAIGQNHLQEQTSSRERTRRRLMLLGPARGAYSGQKGTARQRPGCEEHRREAHHMNTQVVKNIAVSTTSLPTYAARLRCS